MTGYTPSHALPYPEGGDAVAVHTDVQALAAKTDVEISRKASTADIAEAIAPLATTVEVDQKIEAATDTTGLRSVYLAARGA